MTATTYSSSFDDPRPAQNGRDASWYGTLGILAACIGVLVAASFVG